MEQLESLRLYCGLALWIAVWIGSINRAQAMHHSTWLFGWVGLALGPAGFLLTWVATRTPGIPRDIREHMEDLAVAGSVGVHPSELAHLEAFLQLHHRKVQNLLELSRSHGCESRFLEQLASWLRQQHDTEAAIMTRLCGLKRRAFFRSAWLLRRLVASPFL